MSELLILGSGSSAAIPFSRCIIQKEIGCKVCLSALNNPHSKNKRGNPSMIIKYKGNNILIDCGKTFIESAIRFFPKYQIQKVDAILLTHGHADAIMGLDDFREIQLLSEPPNSWKISESTPLFLNENTLKDLKDKFPYIFEDPSKPRPPTLVTRCNPILIDNNVPFDVNGLKITPLPVWHGKNYISLGFMFGEKEKVVYLSDVSEVPNEIMDLLVSSKIDLLFVDCLTKSQPRPSHFHMGQSLDLIRKLSPKRSLLVGLSCDIDYDTVSIELLELKTKEGLDVQLAFDGLVIPVDI